LKEEPSAPKKQKLSDPENIGNTVITESEQGETNESLTTDNFSIPKPETLTISETPASGKD